MLASLKTGFGRILETIVIVLMTAMAVVVLLGIGYRTAGAALVWYDEIASILLAWLTYYGAALAALSRAHIGVPEVMRMLAPNTRAALFVVAELLVFGFFALAAWIAWDVLQILEGSSLVSLPWVPEQVAQHVILVGAVLFMVAEALSIPDAWRKTMGEGPGHGAPEIDPNAEMARTE